MAQRPLRVPPLSVLIEMNRCARADDEWFSEPDDVHRIPPILHAVQEIGDPIEAASTLMARIARSQAFGEGNKRTAFLAGRWLLRANDVDTALDIVSENTPNLLILLVKASMGFDVEGDLRSCLDQARRGRREYAIGPGSAALLTGSGDCHALTTKGRPCRRQGRCPYH